MAITFVSNALGGTATTTTFSITLPATAANDVLILEYTHRATADATIGGTYSGPAFTEKHDQLYATSTFSGKTLWSRATGNHTGQTVTGSGLTDACAAIITIYRGAWTASDPLADATIVGEQNASANETQAAITTTTNGAWVVLVVVNSPDLAVTTQACTSPGTLTARAEVLSTGGTDASIAHASAEKATAGTTGAFTWAQTNAVSGSWAYAIKPQPNIIEAEGAAAGVADVIGSGRDGNAPIDAYTELKPHGVPGVPYEITQVGGITEATGTAAGTGTATGAGAAIKVATGSSAGVGTPTGAGASVGTAVGSSAGLGTATGVRATVTTAAGTSAGVGTATGAAAAIWVATGSSAGLGTATGAAAEFWPATGTAAGTSLVTGAGTALSGAQGSSTGIGTATGVSGATAGVIGSSIGGAVVVGEGENGASPIKEVEGIAAGVATVTGVGEAVSVTAAEGVATGAATVTGSGSAITGATGASAGVAIVTGLGSMIMPATGASAGASTVVGDGEDGATAPNIVEAEGTAAGTSTVTGISGARIAGAASASGTATVTGVSGATVGVVGQAAGLGVAIGQGVDALAPEVPEGGQGGGIAVFPTPPKRRPPPKKILPVVKRKIRGRGGVFFGVSELRGQAQVVEPSRGDPFGLELDFGAFGDFDLEIT